MKIFYRCSFTSSGGFRSGKYDTDEKKLSYISEKSGVNTEISKKIQDIFGIQLERCLLFATDESGHYFLGVYRLEEVSHHKYKYVNAVFYAPDSPEQIFKAYEYFCTHQNSASQMLLDSIHRVELSENLEFVVVPEKIDELLKQITAQNLSENFKSKSFAPNSIIAFITPYTYDDFENNLRELFNMDRDKMIICENCNLENEMVGNYQLATISKNKTLDNHWLVTQNDTKPIRTIPILTVIGIIVVVILRFFFG